MIESEMKYVKKYTSKIRSGLNDLLLQTIDFMRNDTELTKDKLIPLLKPDKLEENLTELYQKVWPYYARQQTAELGNLKAELDWEAEVAKYIEIHLADKITSIKSTQIDEFVRIFDGIQAAVIQQGISTERAAGLLVREMRRHGRDMQKWKAKQITQTEVFGARNNASLTAAREFTIPTLKVWRVLNLGKTERHALIAGLDGQERELDEPFDVGGEPMMQPHEGSPGNVINCYCRMTYKKKEL